MYFLANEHETPVQPIDEEEFTKLQKRRNSFSLHRKTEYLRKTPAHATAEQCVPKTTTQNDNCYSLFGPPKKQGQNLFDLKQDRGVAKRTDCVRNQAVEQQLNNCQNTTTQDGAALNNGENTTTQEDGAATRQLYS